MNELRRHRWTYHALLPIIEVFLKWKFNYEYDDISKIEGPYLLLANHNMELDPAVVGKAVGHHAYFVASEHVLRKGIGTWLLMTFFKPIIHMKGKQGVTTVKQMLKTLKEGHSVCIFPEGNRSFNGLTCDMEAAIGKVAKKAKAKMITYRVEGGYLTQPRWSVTLRKGKLRGRLIHVYTSEELQEMTDEQINQAIVTDLFEDAYETQKRERIAFKGKNLALGLESAIFACPSCKKIGKLHSEENRFYCECGFDSVYDVYGDLTDLQGNKFTVTELDTNQKEILKKKLQTCSDEELLFEDYIDAHVINDKHELISKKSCTIRAYKNYLECGEDKLELKDIEGMAIYSRSALIIHHKNQVGHLEIKSDNIGFSALKYLYLYEMMKHQK